MRLMRSAGTPRSLPASRLGRTGIAFLVLIALAFLQARLIAVYGPQPPKRSTLAGVPYFIFVFNTLWVLFYPLIDWLSVALLARRRLVAIVSHAVAAVVVSAAHLVALYVVCEAFRGLGVQLYWPGKDALVRLAADFAYYNGLLYALLAGAATVRQLGARLKQEELLAARLDSELAKAQLAGLRLQLQPHFLFNALNALSGYVTADPEKAVELIAGLSALLRTLLRSEPEADWPLAAEIDLVQQYLDVERLRFSDRLRVSIAVDPEASRCRVPSVLLLPLVENAVRHGIARTPGPGEIHIEARERHDTIEIAVRDNGPGPGKERTGEQGWGIGLHNTRERLRTAYGPRARLDISGRPEGGTEVRVIVPVHSASAQVV